MRSPTHLLAGAVLGLACIGTVAPASNALAAHSVGSPGQIAWVRSAASRFVTAELAGDGASACAVLNRPLRGTVHGQTCAQRWDARLASMLREHGVRAELRRQSYEIARVPVVIHGEVAQIKLPTPLIKGPNRFLWTENCWMLEG
jgi:hypothetical protein